jgi:hypothetical protein
MQTIPNLKGYGQDASIGVSSNIRKYWLFNTGKFSDTGIIIAMREIQVISTEGQDWCTYRLDIGVHFTSHQ